jgi:hypothetical protein
VFPYVAFQMMGFAPEMKNGSKKEPLSFPRVSKFTGAANGNQELFGARRLQRCLLFFPSLEVF